MACPASFAATNEFADVTLAERSLQRHHVEQDASRPPSDLQQDGRVCPAKRKKWLTRDRDGKETTWTSAQN